MKERKKKVWAEREELNHLETHSSPLNHKVCTPSHPIPHLLTHRDDADHALSGEAVLPAVHHHAAVPHALHLAPQQTRAHTPRRTSTQVIEVNLELQE